VANVRTEVYPAKARHRFVKSFALWINDTLFGQNRSPWLVWEALVLFGAFQAFVAISPYARKDFWVTPTILAAALYAVVFVCISMGLGSYDRAKRFDYAAIVRTALSSAAFAGALSVIFYFFAYYDQIGRFTLVFGVGGSTLLLIAMRALFAWVMRQNPYRFTIIGSSSNMDEVVQRSDARQGFTQIYHHVAWDTLFPGGVPPTVERLLEARVCDIVLTKAALNEAKWIEFAVLALQAKLRVVTEIEFYKQVLERLPIDEVSKAEVIQEGIAKRQVLTVALKRWSDMMMAAVALVVLSPLLLGIALAIKLSSPGPVLFIQPRQGRYSQPFNMWKFRTMRIEESRPDAAGGFTKQADARVTRIGRILRPLHLDELPQLINILLGDMSVVGPRPEALAFARRMRQQIPLYELRYLVRPGLTGHAQLNQGYAMDSVEDTKVKLSYDLYYLCQHTLWLDIQIILRTLFFLAKGAR
jgi:exopolysaccharide biosynthesis polyprenyl glycosylphosphotransferase